MGYPENKFLTAYYKNIGLQTQQALEASPVATAIMEFMNSRTGWEGTATKLLDELEPAAENLKIKTKNNRLWPSGPNSLSRRLNEVRTNLREIGIIVERPVDTTTNTRKIEIRKYRRNARYPRKSQIKHNFSLKTPVILPGITIQYHRTYPRKKTLKIKHKVSNPEIPVILGILYILLHLLHYNAIHQ
jgi:hypothetical protein